MLAAADSRSRLAPLIFLFLLIAANLLYPDSYTDWGYELGSFKLTMIPIWFMLTAPFIVYYIFEERSNLQPGILDLVLLTLIVYVLVRGLAAPDNNTRMIIAYVAYVILLYYGARLLVTGDKALMAACIFMVSLSTLIAAYAIVELFAERNFLYGDDMISLYLLDEGRMLSFEGDPRILYRSNSTIGHPIALGLVLLQFLPFAFYLTSRARRTEYQLLAAAAIAVNIFAIIATYSKSVTLTAAILGMIAFALYFIYHPRHRGRLLAATVVVLVAAGAVVALRYEALAAYNSASLWRNSLTGRIRPLSDLLSGDASTLIIGKGLFQNGAENIWYDSAYTSTFYEQGGIGFVMAALFLVLLVRQIVPLLRRDSAIRLLAAVIAFSMAAMLINGLTYSTFVTWPNMLIFFFVAGLLGSLSRTCGRGSPAAATQLQAKPLPGTKDMHDGNERL